MLLSQKEQPDLYYFNARYYDATIGRFINVDPVQDGTNWYVYCSNNPMCFVDPTGLEDEKIEASKPSVDSDENWEYYNNQPTNNDTVNHEHGTETTTKTNVTTYAPNGTEIDRTTTTTVLDIADNVAGREYASNKNAEIANANNDFGAMLGIAAMPFNAVVGAGLLFGNYVLNRTFIGDGNPIYEAGGQEIREITETTIKPPDGVPSHTRRHSYQVKSREIPDSKNSDKREITIDVTSIMYRKLYER